MKKYILFAAAALALASCSNDEDNTVNNGPVEARISAGVNTPATRAIDNQWEQDAIGVRVTSPSGTMADLYKNVKYTTTANGSDAATFEAATQGIFFQGIGTDEVTFAAYGPYHTSAANALPGTDGVVENSTADQSTRDKQKAFDYIFASGATASRTAPAVQFTGDHAFAHKMTRLVIKVKASAESKFTPDELANSIYTVKGLNHAGTFNATTGKAEATGTASTDDWSLSAYSLKSEADGVTTFTSILFPQTLDEALTFKAKVGGQTYSNSTTIKPDLAAGKSYSYTITVKRSGLEISGCTITAWDTTAEEQEGEAII